jgi:hypothetical protein
MYKVSNLCTIPLGFMGLQPKIRVWYPHTNVTCFLPNFASIPIATLHLWSHVTLKHASKLEEDIYLDVHLNHLILRALEWLHGGL